MRGTGNICEYQTCKTFFFFLISREENTKVALFCIFFSVSHLIYPLQK